jgi:hypothetical protein
MVCIHILVLFRVFIHLYSCCCHRITSITGSKTGSICAHYVRGESFSETSKRVFKLSLDSANHNAALSLLQVPVLKLIHRIQFHAPGMNAHILP